MFMGTTYNSIDEKSRVIVPAKLRSGLGSKCVITRGLDACLYIYTCDDWEKQMEKIAKLPESDPEVRAFIRHFCAGASECDLDKQGRIVIPQELKKYAGITRDLVTMGTMSKIEIWAAERWEDPDNEGNMSSEDFSNALMKYGF